MQECPYCKLKYKDFRSGYDFKSIVEFLWSEKKPWPQKDRKRRLGKLREVKLLLWDQHIDWCAMDYREQTIANFQKDQLSLLEY